MTTTKIAFKTNYNQKKIKNDFFREISGESKTKQDQVVQASITLMAEKFGIDAIINKAKMLEPTEENKLQLYGIDLSKYINEKEKVLNLKRDLEKTFNHLPAAMRKQYFNDDYREFVEAYSSGDLKKLGVLKEYGLVNELQYDKVKNTLEMKANKEKESFEKAVQNAVKAQMEKLKPTEQVNIGGTENAME